jgi:hypothetical protein
MSSCAVSGCGEQVTPDAPVPLCDLHLAVAADWAARADGVTDLLRVPCRLCGSRVGIHYPSGWICAVCEWRVGEIPDDGLPPPRVDVVYYLRHGDRVKIGTTSNPRKRFAAIWHEQLLAFELGDRRLEQRRHAQFASDRFEGSEWFRMSRPLRRHIATVARGTDDPWDRYARWVSEAIALRG